MAFRLSVFSSALIFGAATYLGWRHMHRRLAAHDAEIDRVHSILKDHATRAAVVGHRVNAIQMRLSGIDTRSQLTARRVFADRVVV